MFIVRTDFDQTSYIMAGKWYVATPDPHSSTGQLFNIETEYGAVAILLPKCSHIQDNKWELLEVPDDFHLLLRYGTLSKEANDTVKCMVEFCLNNRYCLGMDEGFVDFDTQEENSVVLELRKFIDQEYPCT